MSDHAIGLIGLALALISIIAPFRWPKMHRIITDLGLMAGSVLLTLALLPYFEPKLVPAIEQARVAPSHETKAPAQPRSAADQKEIDALQTQLASVKAQLATDEKKLQAEYATERRPYDCMDGGHLIDVFNSVRTLDSDAAQAAIKKVADMLDDCIKESGMSEEELIEKMRNGQFGR
jgi:hypothetical protein